MADLDTTLSMRFFTLFPAQKTTAEQKEPIMLYPGGQPVGILLRTDGILVVGYSPVKNETKELHPAQSAGIQAGDIILMHDFIGYDSPTPEALRRVIPALLERGYRFVTVGELVDE